MSKSAYGIVLSKYMRTLIPGTNVIYHGSEPWSTTINMTQKEAKEKLGITSKRKIGTSSRFFHIY